MEKTEYFNTGYISYNVSIQHEIMQNGWKKDPQIFLKCPLENLKIFLFSFNIIILLLNILGWARPNHMSRT